MTPQLAFETVVIYVDDVAAALGFYRQALGLEPRYYDEAVGFAQLGENGAVSIASHGAGELMLTTGYQRAPGGRVTGVEIAFITDAVEAAFERATAAGAIPLTPPRLMPWGQTVAYVGAPEGTIIGFVTKPPTP